MGSIKGHPSQDIHKSSKSPNGCPEDVHGCPEDVLSGCPEMDVLKVWAQRILIVLRYKLTLKLLEESCRLVPKTT
jgi:hypothetical protein